MASVSTRTAMAVAMVAMAMAAVAMAESYECQRPKDLDWCSRVRIKCLEVKREPCEAAGGTYLERGGLCGYCDLCAVYVGESAACNATISDGGNVHRTAICKEPFVCTRGGDGECVVPQSCNYPPEEKE